MERLHLLFPVLRPHSRVALADGGGVGKGSLEGHRWCREGIPQLEAYIKGSIVLSDASAHDSERNLFRAGTILMSQ